MGVGLHDDASRDRGSAPIVGSGDDGTVRTWRTGLRAVPEVPPQSWGITMMDWDVILFAIGWLGGIWLACLD